MEYFRELSDAALFPPNPIRLVNERDRESGVTLIANEFAPNRSLEFADALRQLLKANGVHVATDPDGFPRGAEMFRIQNLEGETIATSMTKYYSWNILKNQLIFGTGIIGGRLSSLSLTRLRDIAATHTKPLDEPTIAIELAYNLVDQRFRGKGLGATMFEARISRALDIEAKTSKFVFTMARGAYLDQGIGNQIFEYALQREAKVNGYNEAGKVNIGGIEISVEEINEQLGLSPALQLDQVHKDSQPIPRLARKFGFVYLGLFKDLSPIFATTMQ